MATVELGRRRRWPILVAGGLVAWFVAAGFVGSGNDDDPEAGLTSTTTTTAATASTATTSTVPGGPLLGEPGGLQLVLDTGGAEPIIVDLDTGALTTRRLGRVLASRPDGLVAALGGSASWLPFPLTADSAVPLGEAVFAFPVPGQDLVWLSTIGTARLVGLDGLAVGEAVSLPIGAEALGAVDAGLVIGAAGDTFVVAADGSTTLVDGEPVLVSGDAVYVRTCDQALACTISARDVASGEARSTSVLDGPTVRVDAHHPDGRALVGVFDEGRVERYGLVDGVELLPVLPPTVAPTSANPAWTPDGRLLLMRTAASVHVVDPFAAGGPVDLREFPLPRAVSAMYVVGPAPA